MNIDKKIICIYGPTITKKTGLAAFIAKYVWGKYNIEPVLINADSRKVYADLNIGQVKIAPPWDKKLKVEMNKFMPLNRRFSLYDYKTMAEEIIDISHSEGKLPILFGGTGVYHLAITENWEVERNAHRKSGFREISGKKADQSGKWIVKYDPLVLMPFVEKDRLYPAVLGHIEGHFKEGLFKEAKSIAKKYKFDFVTGLFDKNPYNVVMETIGYREFFEFAIKNAMPLDAFNTRELNLIKKNMFSNLKDMVRKQIRLTDNFRNYKIVEKFEDSKRYIDEFLR